jgi:hypothetical protein
VISFPFHACCFIRSEIIATHIEEGAKHPGSKHLVSLKHSTKPGTHFLRIDRTSSRRSILLLLSFIFISFTLVVPLQSSIGTCLVGSHCSPTVQALEDPFCKAPALGDLHQCIPPARNNNNGVTCGEGKRYERRRRSRRNSSNGVICSEGGICGRQRRRQRINTPRNSNEGEIEEGEISERRKICEENCEESCKEICEETCEKGEICEEGEQAAHNTEEWLHQHSKHLLQTSNHPHQRNHLHQITNHLPRINNYLHQKPRDLQQRRPSKRDPQKNNTQGSRGAERCAQGDKEDCNIATLWNRNQQEKEQGLAYRIQAETDTQVKESSEEKNQVKEAPRRTRSSRGKPAQPRSTPPKHCNYTEGRNTEDGDHTEGRTPPKHCEYTEGRNTEDGDYTEGRTPPKHCDYTEGRNTEDSDYIKDGDYTEGCTPPKHCDYTERRNNEDSDYTERRNKSSQRQLKKPRSTPPKHCEGGDHTSGQPRSSRKTEDCTTVTPQKVNQKEEALGCTRSS